MARGKQTRQLMRTALSMSKPTMSFIPVVSNETVLRFLVRVSRHLPVAFECILSNDVQHWTVPCAQIILDDGRLVDVVVWQCLFKTGIQPAVVNVFLEDPRYNRREWQIPLRLHHCIPHTRSVPRHCGPLIRLVSGGATVADLGDCLDIIAFSSNAFSGGIGARWWRATKTGIDVWQTADIVVVAWLLRRLQNFLQTRSIPTQTPDEHLPTSIENRVVQ